MKIVTIWNTYGPYHLARVKALEHSITDADIVCFSHCKTQDDYNFFDLEPKKHRVLVPKNAAQLRFFESLIATLRALWQECPDLVLTCSYDRPETLAAVIWAKMSGNKVFLMLDNQYDDSPRYVIKEFTKRIYLAVFNGFIYGGDTHKDYLRRLGVPKKHEVYGYNCVDNDGIWLATLESKNLGHRLFADNDYFMCVARMIPKKNLVRMILAYSAYVDKIKHAQKPWSLVICGDGSERLRVEETIRDCGVVDQVLLVGRVDNFEQIINYYAFARALVIASHENEQWGLVVNEAMASGLPVLVSKQCGCASSLVKDGENGFTFDGKSVEQLTAHLLWMHNNEEKLQAMGECSRKIIQDFSPKKLALNILGLYERVNKIAQ